MNSITSVCMSLNLTSMTKHVIGRDMSSQLVLRLSGIKCTIIAYEILQIFSHTLKFRLKQYEICSLIVLL